jgi:hypothetical protein
MKGKLKRKEALDPNGGASSSTRTTPNVDNRQVARSDTFLFQRTECRPMDGG